MPPEVSGADSGEGVRALTCDAGALKQDFGNCPRQPAAATGSDVNAAAQSHPSTRAGGKYDVSSKQTLSNDSSEDPKQDFRDFLDFSDFLDFCSPRKSQWAKNDATGCKINFHTSGFHIGIF